LAVFPPISIGGKAFAANLPSRVIMLALSFQLSPRWLAQHGHEARQEAPPIKLATDLVSLSIAVTDQMGQAILGLKKEDFKVYENGIEQTISFFSAEEAPACWGLVPAL
jgi:hypothetical protein